jgi:glycosyltransferase involved in cell wall biosynthesis
VKRVNVAVVTDALYPWHKGGKEVRYLHLLNGLAEHGMDVVVYSMKWWDQTPEATLSASGSLSYRAICPHVPLYRGNRRSIFQAVVFALASFRLLWRRFDVIEADHMPYLQLIPLRIIASLKRVPLVVTWNEVWGKERWRSYIGRLGAAAALVERLSLRLPDVIVAISPGTAQRLSAMGVDARKVFVVPVALDSDKLQSRAALATAPELLFVGRLIDHKNANLAVEATRILKERGHDVRLGIVGVGPEETRLRAQVAESGLDADVTFYGTIESQEDLWSLIRGSRVLLAPSVREGFGLVVAESLALGTPVVCASHPENESASLVGRETGSLIPPFDAQALADAAQAWLSDDSHRVDRVASFLKEHGEFTARAMSTSYADIIRSVI